MDRLPDLLTPPDCLAVFADQQAGFAFAAPSMERRAFLNNSIALARTPGVFKVPVVASTSASKVYSGPLMPALQAAARAVLAGYVVLGSGWLNLNATAELRGFAESKLRLATPIFVVAAASVCIAAAFVQPGVGAVWTARLAPLARAAILFVSTSLVPQRAIGGRSDGLRFALGLILFGLGLAGLGLAIDPDIVPFRLPLWQAASSTNSHVFLLIGAMFVTPVVLAYSAFACRVFRGKTPTAGWEL
jgi:cytochrome d ubiquinol oxidase subunit II